MKSQAASPAIVAIGGTVKPNSSTERALNHAIAAVRALGGNVRVFDGSYLAALPHYGGADQGTGSGRDLVEAVRDADGLLIAAPGYHGSLSGLVKNALDYLEELSGDPRPYLDGRAVGLIATAYGDQAATSTLATLRAIVHALRGWPTPMGAAIRSHGALFASDGECTDTRVRAQIDLVVRQVVFGARSFSSQDHLARVAS